MERCVGLENDAHVRADPRHVVCVERQADGEPLVDEHVAKGRAEEVEGDQTRLFHVLDLVDPARGRIASR